MLNIHENTQALLSDGVLAWRVYVVWNQPNWLRYVLVATLLMNSGASLLLLLHAVAHMIT